MQHDINRPKEPEHIVFPQPLHDVEEVEYVVLKKEPQAIVMPKKPKPKKSITGDVTDRWVAFPYPVDENGEIYPKISLAACEWIIHHCTVATYNFSNPSYLLVHHYEYDGVEPPDEWQ